jgi:hypothetical protein
MSIFGCELPWRRRGRCYREDGHVVSKLSCGIISSILGFLEKPYCVNWEFLPNMIEAKTTITLAYFVTRSTNSIVSSKKYQTVPGPLNHHEPANSLTCV